MSIRLVIGTCKWLVIDELPLPDDTGQRAFITTCGQKQTWWPDSTPRFCPSCGKSVKEVRT